MLQCFSWIRIITYMLIILAVYFLCTAAFYNWMRSSATYSEEKPEFDMALHTHVLASDL